jgi:preprotein translocase subunit Sec63
MKPEDILGRIINHEFLLEEDRYVKNLSKGILSTKKNVVALKVRKKSKKKQIQVESSSEEEQDEDEEDEEKGYGEEERALFIMKFNKYISKRRPFK